MKAVKAEMMRFFQLIKSKAILVVLLVSMGLLTNVSHAANRNWTGAVSTDFFNAGNWSPLGLPISLDTVNIGSGKTVTGKPSLLPIALAGITVGAGSTVNIESGFTINGPLTLNSAMWLCQGNMVVNGALTLTDSTWAGDSDMTVNGAMTLTRSTWAGKGNIAVNGAATATTSTLSGANFTVNNTFNATDCTFTGAFKQTINRSGVLTLLSNGGVGNTIDIEVSNKGIVNWNSGNLVVNKAFKNEAGATVTLESSGTLSGNALSSLFQNAGKVKRSKNASTGTIIIPYTNTGILDVDTGTLEFVEPFAQESGECNLNGGKIKAPKGMKIKSGKLAGTGTIDGDVLNEGGNVAPGHSPGAITINGNYTQTSNGTLNMEIAGTSAGTQYDQLIINGTANLAGTLNLTMLNGFVPKAGNNFQLLTYYSAVGSWASYTGFDSAPGITFTKTQTPTYFIATAQTTQIVDSTPPAVSVTGPTSGLFAKVKPIVSGAAADEASGSGLASKTLLLYRYAAGSVTAGYWNGTAWDATYNSATHERAISGTTATWTFTLPTLADGKYYVRATAKDKSGNATVSPSMIFTLDQTVPTTLTLVAPAPSVWLQSLDAILSNADDNTNGSGIDRVELSIKRNADNCYWNGTGWVSTSQFIRATPDSFAANGWGRRHSTATPLPMGANLKNGAYTLTTNAYDKAGNVKALATTFNVDIVAPTVVIKAPVSNTNYTAQPSANGTAADTGGSGVASVKVRLYRYATATTTAGYWAGGTTWNANYSAANDILATGTSTWSLTLPSLTNGNYALESVVTDKVGNSTVSPLTVFTKSAGTSAIFLSTMTASVTNKSVALVFTGTLDAVVAKDISRYNVVSGGMSVIIQSASYNATSNTVTLTVEAGAVVAGSSVTVNWTKLFDTTGKIITGTATVTP